MKENAMPDHYEIIDTFPLESASRASTDVIEVFSSNKELLLYLNNNQTPRIIHGPATIVADKQNTEGSGIRVNCLRQLLFAASDDLLWDGRAYAVNEGVRRGMRRGFLTKIYPKYPSIPPQSIDGTYSIYALGGFIPLVLKGWRIVQLNRHMVEWIALGEHDKRIRDDMFL